MMAAEVEEGLLRLSIEHHTTLPYCPEQNARAAHCARPLRRPSPLYACTLDPHRSSPT
jgi:hypothetical protein